MSSISQHDNRTHSAHTRQENLYIVARNFLLYPYSLTIVYPFPGPKIHEDVLSELALLLQRYEDYRDSCLRYITLRFQASPQDPTAAPLRTFPISGSDLDHFYILEDALLNSDAVLTIDCPFIRMEGPATLLHDLLRSTVFRRLEGARRLNVICMRCRCI